MSYSDLDNENVIAFKEYIARSWKIILSVVVLVLAIIWGWKYWQSHRAKHYENSSQQYTKLVGELNSEKAETVTALTQFSQQTNNIYGAFGSLVLARFYVDSKEYSKAEEQLQQALNKTKFSSLNDVILLRIARLQMQLQKPDDAITTLKQIKNNAALAEIDELLGDIYVMKKEYENAEKSYQSALTAGVQASQTKRIAMKMNEVVYLKNSTSKS